VLIVPSIAWVLSFPVSKVIKILTKNTNSSLKMRRGFNIIKNLYLIPALLSFTLMLFLFSNIVPIRFVFSPENAIWFGYPGINVREDEYKIVFDLFNELEPDSYVIAPYHQAWMFPTFKKPIWAVSPRPLETDWLEDYTNVDEKEIEIRRYLFNYAYYREELDLSKLNESFEIFDINLIIVKPDKTKDFDLLSDYLDIMGYEIHDLEYDGDFVFWVKE
jgi:hypothetical protein